MTFAAQLKPHVERLGAAECARLCGVSPRVVQLWLRGERNPTYPTRVGVLTILGGHVKI